MSLVTAETTLFHAESRSLVVTAQKNNSLGVLLHNRSARRGGVNIISGEPPPLLTTYSGFERFQGRSSQHHLHCPWGKVRLRPLCCSLNWANSDIAT